VRRVPLGFLLSALCATLAAAPAAAQAHVDLPSTLRPQPLPAALTPEVATPASVVFTARSGRPVWLLPAAGMVAGAILYPMLVEPSCEDCTVYIPEPAMGAMLGLMGGILLEVSLRLISGDLPVSALPLSAGEPSAARPGTRMLP
jgi:hypothetical protein